MQAGDIELCQCTLHLLTFSISGFPALRRELLGEEIYCSACLQDGVQERAPVGNRKPLCSFCFHSKVNNGWCHWSQGNWLSKLWLKTAKSVLLGTFWLPDCTVLTLLTNIYWIKKRHVLGMIALPCRSACILDGGKTAVTTKPLLAYGWFYPD